MGSLLPELGYNEIISAKIAIDLRSYIASRNPGLPPSARAGIFADAVNRIVDGRLPRFNGDVAGGLKELLFRQAAAKPVFSIDCADVLIAAVGLKTLGYEFLRELNEWLSAVLKREVVRESLFDLVMQAHRLMDSAPGGDIGRILSSAEQNGGGLKYAGEEPGFAADTMNEAPAIVTGRDYDSGEDAEEHIQTKERTAGNSPAGSAPNWPELPELVKAGLPLAGFKRNAAMSAFAAAALVVMLFAGNMPGAALNVGSSRASEVFSAAIQADSLVYAVKNRKTEDLSIAPSVSERSGRRMKATAYDLSFGSCGKRPGHPQYGITSSGTKAAAGRTVAVDPAVIPLGTRLLISFPGEYSELDGVYVAEDTGRLIKGDAIDIFFGEDREGSREIYERAMEFGVRYVDVRVLK